MRVDQWMYVIGLALLFATVLVMIAAFAGAM
jgi:hypothetical protein